MDLKELETTNDLPSLPFEIIIEILSRLPVKPVVRFKCVSKQWYALINSLDFIKLHLSQSLQKNSTGTLILHKGSSLYTFDFHNLDCHATKLYYPENINLSQPNKLVGSCNGLVCFTLKDNDDQLALFNPVTRAYKILPKFPLRGFKTHCDKVELAYDCISNDYKVLCVKRIKNFGNIEPGYQERETLLYSLSTNAWETIINPPWSWDSVISPCVVVNNSLHWMDFEHKGIKSFDLFTRRYYEIPLPEKISPGYKPVLAFLRGQLFVVTFYFDIWILKEYDVTESWTRCFVAHLASGTLYSSLHPVSVLGVQV